MMKIYALVILLGLLAVPFTVGIITIKADASSDGDNEDQSCDASYPDVYIPSPSPDLNCDDITDKNFKVVSLDPHGFDREGDGRVKT